MPRKFFDLKSISRAAACLAILIGSTGMAFGQGGGRAKKSASKAATRSKTSPADLTASDRITLRGGEELLGQVDDSSRAGTLVVLARREWVRANLPGRVREWEAADESATVAANRQRRERLIAWRRQRPAEPVPGDRITAWLDRELAGPPKGVAPSPLIAIPLGRDAIQDVQRRGEQASRALRCAWLLGLADPEITPLATLADAIAGRGMTIQGGEPIAIDRLMLPSVESEDRWLLRRAATEALNDDGLRFIRFGTTILPEPVAGQRPDPAAGVAIVGGTIRDVLGVGGPDPLPARLRDIASRGRVGLLITSIEVSADLGAVSAESTLYYHGSKGWDRGPWRSGSLQVGAVPPTVVMVVARDPQVRAVIELVESIGGGLISPEMKDRGLVMGTTAGGAVLLARTSLVTSLAGLALNLGGDDPIRGKSAKP